MHFFLFVPVTLSSFKNYRNWVPIQHFLWIPRCIFGRHICSFLTILSFPFSFGSVSTKIPIYLPSSHAGCDIGQGTPTSSSHFSPLLTSCLFSVLWLLNFVFMTSRKSHPLLHHPFPVSFSPMIPCTALSFSRFEWLVFLLSDWLVLRDWREKWLLFKQKAEKAFLFCV